MADMPKPAYTNLAAAMKTVMSAHAAVREGIATHGQKHTEERRKTRERLAAERKLNPNGVITHG